MRDTADEQALRRQLESWAADRVKAWGELHKDDYDFRSWAKGASKNCLSAGAIYDYARESRKLRGLLALMNPTRPREDWEIVRPGSIDGREPEPGEIESYPTAATWLHCSFEGLDEYQAERALGGFFYCLCDLADHLADNIGFGELFRTKRAEIEKAFGGLNELARIKGQFRYFLPLDDAVEMATQSEAERATVLESFSPDGKRIIFGEACSEVIAVQIHWRFTNSEIFATMKKLLTKLRPGEEKYKPRQPKKGSRRDSIQSALDCLTAMRLTAHFRKTPATDPAKAFAASHSGDSIESSPYAINRFDAVRLGGRGDYIEESNFDALITKAHKVFKKSFPFGENAANALTFKDRIMMKSERVSSQDKA